MESAGQLQAEVVCPGSEEFREAEAAGGRISGLAPIPIDQAPWWVTLFTSMFMHGGISHLREHAVPLVFGNNIEDSMGGVKFALFYLLAGLIAVYSQALIDPGSTAPTIGASGAVAGVLGAYALLHPRRGSSP